MSDEVIQVGGLSPEALAAFEAMEREYRELTERVYGKEPYLCGLLPRRILDAPPSHVTATEIAARLWPVT